MQVVIFAAFNHIHIFTGFAAKLTKCGSFTTWVK